MSFVISPFFSCFFLLFPLLYTVVHPIRVLLEADALLNEFRVFPFFSFFPSFPFTVHSGTPDQGAA